MVCMRSPKLHLLASYRSKECQSSLSEYFIHDHLAAQAGRVLIARQQRSHGQQVVAINQAVGPRGRCLRIGRGT